jgi:4-hydroxybutyrate CoA-transferase
MTTRFALREISSLLGPDQRVFIHGGAATPIAAVQALCDDPGALRNVELIHLHTFGVPRYAQPEFRGVFKVANLFVGANMRGLLDHDRVDYLPCFLSEIPALFRSGRRPLDAAIVHLSPPDRHGFCTLGTSVDVARAAVDSARTIIGIINPNMPRTHGDGLVHVSRITHLAEDDSPLPEVPPEPLGEVERRIGSHCASLIEDGATLQMGIGSIPDAVLASLDQHRHLGIHTEMWSDGAVRLIESGVVDNSRKAVHPGKTVAAFVMGSRAVYDYCNDNPSSVLLDVAYVNQTGVIARNPRVTAINSAVEIDLTGQVCADSIGHRIISGVGGQMDFMRGAALSAGGKPILALPSRTAKGVARIVPTLKAGAGVVTTRAHVHHVVTEYGIADLYGKTLSERAQALTGIAHPDDRESLAAAWKQACQ